MTEDLLLDKTLEVLDTNGYEAAYEFLLSNRHQLCETDANASSYYFLSCLAAGCQQPEAALQWLEEAIVTKGFWFRPEMLEDDDLSVLSENEDFQKYIQLSRDRFLEAQNQAKPICTWQVKEKPSLLLNFHGNGENAAIAQNTWQQLESQTLQVEAVQSSRVHAYERFRWHYDDTNYQDATGRLQEIAEANYDKLFLGGFSAGCDMILRILTLTDTTCHTILLQSPWTPFIETHAEDIAAALKSKNIRARIYCGALDENSLVMANKLHASLQNSGVDVLLEIQPNLRHQFPEVLGSAYSSVIE